MWENCLVVWGKSCPLHSPPTPLLPSELEAESLVPLAWGSRSPWSSRTLSPAPQPRPLPVTLTLH